MLFVADLQSSRTPNGERCPQIRRPSFDTTNETIMASCYEIATMSMEHYAQVLELWRVTEGVMLTDADTPERAPDYFRRNPGMSHVALAESKVVGAALCGHDGRRGYLHHLAVASGHRRRGLGRRIVTACLNQLAHAGITACNLFVFDDHHQGKSFWVGNDFAEWTELRIMTRRLSPVTGSANGEER